MNSWLLFSLLAPLLWAFSNVIDSAARRHFVKSDLAMSWLASLTRLPIIPLFFWWGGFQVPALGTVLWLILAGLLWTLPFILYYKSLAFEETSRVVLFLEFLPMLTMVIAYGFIGEKLTLIQGLAFVVILLGNVLAAFRRGIGRWHFSKAFALMMLANLGWALGDVLFKKHAAGFDNFFVPAAFYAMGMFLFALMFCVHPKVLRSMTHPFRGLPSRAWKLIILDEATGLLGTFAFAYALTLGPASLTAVLTGIQPIAAFLISLVLARTIPEITREEVTKSALSFKGIAFVLVAIGLWMLS